MQPSDMMDGFFDQIKEERKRQDESLKHSQNMRALDNINSNLKMQNHQINNQNNILQQELDNAKKSAARSRVFSWVTFAITTIISITALVLSIVL